MSHYQIKAGQAGLVDITETVEDQIRREHKECGICLITVLDDKSAVLVQSREKTACHLDILEDFDRIFPPRLNYRGKEDPETAAAGSKAAVMGSSLEIPICSQRAAIEHGQGVFLADFLGGRELEYIVRCC